MIVKTTNINRIKRENNLKHLSAKLQTSYPYKHILFIIEGTVNFYNL